MTCGENSSNLITQVSESIIIFYIITVSLAITDTSAWEQMDATFKSWLYYSVVHPLIWDNLEALFRDNTHSRVMELNNELRNITIRESSITNYFNKFSHNIKAKVPGKNLVIYAIKDLSPKLTQMLKKEELLMKRDEARFVHETYSDRTSSLTTLNTQHNPGTH
ncbi:hypothetical protein LXL04_027943 [Taraxacum kok-saghyz]